MVSDNYRNLGQRKAGYVLCAKGRQDKRGRRPTPEICSNTAKSPGEAGYAGYVLTNL